MAMWQCLHCREETADNVDVCWHCGVPREVAASRESQAEPDDPSVPDQAEGGQATPGGRPERTLTQASLAVLLIRFMGLSVTAYGVVNGVVAIGHLLLLLRRFGLDHGWGYQLEYLIRPGVELVIGIYLLLGGQWVYNKLLTPVRRGTTEEDDSRDR
jgi:hypothetical protein